MWKKRSFLFLLLLPVLFCGCGASVTPADPGQEESADTSAADEGPAEEEVEEGLLRLGVTGDVDTMDVHKTTADYMVPLNIYERLFDIQTNDDGTTELVPGLAEDYKVSKDGRTYSFTLRDDAYFSDGTRVTASDVAFSFTRMLALEDTLQSDFADAILGAEAVMNRKTDTLKGSRWWTTRT